MDIIYKTDDITLKVHCILVEGKVERYLQNHTYHHYNVPKTNENPEVAKISEKICKLLTYRSSTEKLTVI